MEIMNSMGSFMKDQANQVSEAIFNSYVVSFFQWIILIGAPVILYVARSTGVWFNNFNGIVILCSSLIGIALLVIKVKFYINTMIFILLITFSTSSLISILVSSSFGTNYWSSKLMIYLGNIVLVGLLSVMASHYTPKPMVFFVLSISSILVSLVFIFQSLYSNLAVIFVRVASEGNATALANSIAFSFGFITWYYLRVCKVLVSLTAALLGLVIVFTLGTRQAVLVFQIILLLQYLSYFSNKDSISCGQIIKGRGKNFAFRRLPIIILLFFVLFFGLLFARSYSESALRVIETMWNSSILRWNVFLDEKQLDEGRTAFNNAALLVWQDAPLFGRFAYERQGQWAHNTIIDSLAQIGLVGTSLLVILWIVAVTKSFFCLFSRESISNFKIYFSSVFIALSVSSLLVTTNLTNPTFIFCLFYMASTRLTKDQSPSQPRNHLI